MNGEDEEGGMVMGPQGLSIAELCAEMLRLSTINRGEIAFKFLLASVKYGNTMLGGVIDPESGEKKYPLDDMGHYEHPILKHAMSKLYEKGLQPNVKGEITPGRAGSSDIHNITVGDKFQMRGNTETAGIYAAQALDYSWSIALWKAQGITDPFFHILGEEELLPAHLNLSEIGEQRALASVVDADIDGNYELSGMAEEMAEDIAMAKIRTFVEEGQILIKDDALAEAVELEDDGSTEEEDVEVDEGDREDDEEPEATAGAEGGE